MAAKRKASKRSYGKKASDRVGRAMHEMKEGKLRSGRSKKPVKSRKQAIAIGLSEARAEGAKVPTKRKGAAKKRARKSPAKKRARKGRAKKRG